MTRLSSLLRCFAFKAFRRVLSAFTPSPAPYPSRTQKCVYGPPNALQHHYQVFGLCALYFLHNELWPCFGWARTAASFVTLLLQFLALLDKPAHPARYVTDRSRTQRGGGISGTRRERLRLDRSVLLDGPCDFCHFCFGFLRQFLDGRL